AAAGQVARRDRQRLRGDAEALARQLPRAAGERPRPRPRRPLHPDLGLLPLVLRGGVPDAGAARRPARARQMSWWELLLLGWALAATLQFGLYLDQLRTGKATAVDAGWAASLVGIAVLYAVLGPGHTEHRALIAAVAGIEFSRIAWVVSRRIPGEEDRRYRELRARWRGREQRTFFVFFQAQALLAALLA